MSRTQRPALFITVIAALLGLLAVPATSQDLSPRPKEKYPRGTMFVSGFGNNAVFAFKAADGSHLATIGPLANPQSITLGPDGLLYVCAEGDNEIVRIHPRRFEIVDSFVFDDPMTGFDETGGLNGPTAATFGPDGRLYVASFNTDSVLRYDGSTGEFDKVFIQPGAGALNGPDAGMTFGPDGDLYIPSFFNDRVLRYGPNGGWRGAFIEFREGALMEPRDLAFHKGSWYVASSGNNRILRFDSLGNFRQRFANTNVPYSLAFHPDNGNLYSLSLNRNNVRMFDGKTGAFIRRIVSNGSAGLSQATYMYFYMK